MDFDDPLYVDVVGVTETESGPESPLSVIEQCSNSNPSTLDDIGEQHTRPLSRVIGRSMGFFRL